MQNISALVTDLSTDEENCYEVRVEAKNLPETVAAGAAAWAISMELGIDLDTLNEPASTDEVDCTWYFTFEA